MLKENGTTGAFIYLYHSSFSNSDCGISPTCSWLPICPPQIWAAQPQCFPDHWVPSRGGRPARGSRGREVDQPLSILLGRREESSTFLHPGQLAQGWGRSGFVPNVQLWQSYPRKATLQQHQNNLNEIQRSGQSPLLGAVPLSQRQCLRTIASPSTRLHPRSPASQRRARHIFKALWIQGHPS